ncbi:hypothetical protein KIPB_013023, partial [Kipferlia bialata]
CEASVTRLRDELNVHLSGVQRTAVVTAVDQMDPADREKVIAVLVEFATDVSASYSSDLHTMSIRDTADLLGYDEFNPEEEDEYVPMPRALTEVPISSIGSVLHLMGHSVNLTL